MCTLMDFDAVELADIDFVFPRWIQPTITAGEVAAIIQSGCTAGSYAPAATYRQAQLTMAVQGDEVLRYIETVRGELPAAPIGTSWAGMASFYNAVAVELWAASVESELLQALQDHA